MKRGRTGKWKPLYAGLPTKSTSKSSQICRGKPHPALLQASVWYPASFRGFCEEMNMKSRSERTKRKKMFKRFLQSFRSWWKKQKKKSTRSIEWRACMAYWINECWSDVVVKQQREWQISSSTSNVKHTAPFTQHCTPKHLYNPVTHNAAPICNKEQDFRKTRATTRRRRTKNGKKWNRCILEVFIIIFQPKGKAQGNHWKASQYIYATDCILHTFTMAAFTWRFVFKKEGGKANKNNK